MNFTPTRVLRVGAGFARPATRKKYVAAARRRLSNSGLSSAGQASDKSCRVCGSDRTTREHVKNRKLGREMNVIRCQDCGHVCMYENTRDYSAITSEAGFKLAARVGTPERPGREFHMAELATAALKRDGLSVLIYGAGRSADNQHIARLPQVSSVAIGDVMQFRTDADFIDLTKRVRRSFDIVVACEVIEHFEQPRDEFAKLFKYVKPDGLLICSTNINNNGDLNRQRYIFGSGHVAYYTPGALRRIADAHGFHLDFRVPVTATGRVGPRKRYVMFSKSADVMNALSDWFGSNMYAPSEPAEPKRA